MTDNFRIKSYFLQLYRIAKSNKNFPRRVTKKEMSMLKEMHPKGFSNDRGVTGMHASLKPSPKPPSFLSASRNLSFHRQKKPFQVAYDGPSFYTRRFLDDRSSGQIVTRLLSRGSTVPPFPDLLSLAVVSGTGF